MPRRCLHEGLQRLCLALELSRLQGLCSLDRRQRLSQHGRHGLGGRLCRCLGGLRHNCVHPARIGHIAADCIRNNLLLIHLCGPPSKRSCTVSACGTFRRAARALSRAREAGGLRG